MIRIYKIDKSLKTAMGRIVKITEVLRRGMRDDNIHTACLSDSMPDLSNAAGHFRFRILIRPVMIPQASAETEYPDSIVRYKLSVDIVTAGRRILGITAVMVSVYIE